MKITAIGIGTRGDVQPLCELGYEMRSRGHDFVIATQEDFHALAESKGVPYIHLDGSAEHLMQYLVIDNRGDLDFVKGSIKLFKENPNIIDQIAEAVKGSDLVIYNFLGGFAYHPCELYKIPCVRVFYSPFDATEKYSLYTPEHNSKKVYKSYSMEEFGMNLLTVLLANKWRRAHGLKKWTMKSDYRYQGKVPVETFYPVSPMLMEPDPKWGEHIHVPGWWFHPEDTGDYEPGAELKAFLEAGEAPVFAGFGRMFSPEFKQIQQMTLRVFEKRKIRAVMQAPLLTEEEKAAAPDNICFLPDNIPYGWLFPRVKAVIHHGGNSTNGLGLRVGKPTLVIALALDQFYYGRTVHELGLGPKPIYICKKMCTEEELESAVAELDAGIYAEAAQRAGQQLVTENGCLAAAEILEKRFA